MNQLSTISTAITTMTSREMSDLTEKRHDNVKRTIDTLAENGVISKPQIEYGEKAANGVVEKLYRIGKRDSYVIVAQLSPEFTARVVDRWQELETKAIAAQQVKTIRQAARETMNDIMADSALFEIPTHLAQIEATKEVLKLHGVDFSPYLKLAPAQQNILREEESLEPTDLGKTIGYTGKDFNLLLEAGGMQVRTAEGWMPTEEGKPYASAHSWSTKSKSGYNFKWRRSVLKQLDY